MQCDVLVAGAGPAGLATAIAASEQGLRTIVVDCRRPPIEKVCGEGLLPQAISCLRDLGVGLEPGLGYPITGIRFSDECSSITAAIPRGEARGMRRTQLHNLLAEHAERRGVAFLWGERLCDFKDGAARAGDTRISFRWLIGADGQNSSVRKWAGLDARSAGRRRYGFRRHYELAPWSGLVETHWGERCQLIVTPTGREEICVVLLTRDPRLRIGTALDQFPALAARLRGARPLSAERGMATSLGRLPRVTNGRTALAGDASCTIDGIAGQGLCLALQQARSLTVALVRQDLTLYELAHRRIGRMPVRMTRLLLLMDRNANLRRRALRLFAKRPGLFARMVAAHTDGGAESEFKASEIVHLGWRMLWA
ncbi:MAG TPA: NAD(P)/FAD-dependent oxidoreductase [Candidatus Acidoferrales bacterium]|nr:NAD(P)/FAD-dependent oxidoreductase [Candidatus Acidoferrales bacterium]